jgi:cysteine desulfurase
VPYLDHASISPVGDAVRAAMADAPWEDPTRLYTGARRSRRALDDARASCAAAIAGRAEEVTFTSGGTEALALAVHAAIRAARAARRPMRIVVTAIEQRSVLDAVGALDDVEVVTVGVDGTGIVDAAAFEDAIGPGAALAAVQVANLEIGTCQDVGALAAIAAARKTWVLADASAAAGWIPIDVRALGADLLAVSGSRCGGPSGTGFLWTKSGVRLRPMLAGDDRERGARAGMPNLAGLVGLGVGLTERVAVLAEVEPRVRAHTDALRAGLPAAVGDVLVHGHPTKRVPHIVSFSIPLVEGDALLLGLDAAGFAVHSGSACTSSTAEPSHVLAAIGTLTHGAIRVSIGSETTGDDIDAFVTALPDVVSRAKARLGRR